MEAGHLTTRQHAHFVFVLSGVSRQFIWSFLHSHPFYNSEQVSQRYVEVRPGNVVMPSLPEPQAALYRSTVEDAMGAYKQLIELLTPKGEESLRFFVEVMGMDIEAQEGQSYYLRGWGDYQRWSLKLTEAGTSGMRYLGLRAWSQDALERLVGRVEATGLGEGWTDGSRDRH